MVDHKQIVQKWLKYFFIVFVQDIITDLTGFESDSLKIDGVEDATAHEGMLQGARYIMRRLIGMFFKKIELSFTNSWYCVECCMHAMKAYYNLMGTIFG